MRYAITVAYDGTHFCGWQVQTNGRTVQEELQNAVFSAFGERVTVTASGRTDAGVHALAQVCHLDLNTQIAGEKLADALNARLPEDISVTSSALAPDGFDANRSAKRKTYCYRIYTAQRRNPLLERYAVWQRGGFDNRKFEECAKLFEGEHDFVAYCASGSQVKTTVRTVYSVKMEQNDGIWNVSVCGNGFLYNMVRTLVGTMLWYATGKLTYEQVVRSIECGDRNCVGKTMPANGLMLYSVEYEDSPF